MNSPFQKNNTPELQDNSFRAQNYKLYQLHNKEIFALVDKVSDQIAYVIWKKQWEETHIFNGFEAGSIKAMWNSKNRKSQFIPNISLQKKETQQNLERKIKLHKQAKKLQEQKKLHLESLPLNDDIPDGIFEYKNGKNQIFEIWILWWRIRNISHTRWNISPAQKAAITKAIKNYSKDNQSNRLYKKDSIPEWNIIQHDQYDLNNPEIDKKIMDLFINIWDTSLWITKQQLSTTLQVYKYYAQLSNLSHDEQAELLQNNNNISFLFSGIIWKMKSQKITNMNYHIQRLHVIKNILIEWNNQKTQN